MTQIVGFDSRSRSSTYAHLVEIIFPPPRHFGIRLWQGTELPREAPSPFSLVLHHPGAMRRMFKAPVELSLGEAFIRGDFEIEGDISSAFPLMGAIAARALGIRELVELGLGLQALPSLGRVPQQGRGLAW
jgi:cyclopropane-fatty-acyl-phospholipid synthase